MAVGKNKRLTKGKKGGKKKVVDPFSRKEWYDVVAPALYTGKREFCKTLVTKTTGNRIASEYLKGRVFEVSLGDLNKDEEQSFRKIKLKVEEVDGKNCLTNFYGMSFSTDKLRSLVRKWQTTVEAWVDVKTADGYTLRLFVIGFTKRRQNQVRATTYAQTSQIKQIRKKMADIITKHAAQNDVMNLMKIIPDVIGKEIEKACFTVYPLSNVFVHKMKILKAPKFDILRLREIHTESAKTTGPAGDAGAAVDPAQRAQLEGRAS